MREERIEGEGGLVCKVLEVLLHITVEDGEEAYVIVLKRHKVGDMQRPDRIRRFMCFIGELGPRRGASGQSLAHET